MLENFIHLQGNQKFLSMIILGNINWKRHLILVNCERKFLLLLFRMKNVER